MLPITCRFLPLVLLQDTSWTSCFFAWDLNLLGVHVSHEKNPLTSDFPLYPGCLTGILPHITG